MSTYNLFLEIYFASFFHLTLICRELYLRFLPGMLRIFRHLCCSWFEYFTFFCDISKKKFFHGVAKISPPPSNVGNIKNEIEIFPNFFLGFMIEKISYYWLFLGKNSKFFKYFWSTTNPNIHWYLAKFIENLRKFRFLGEISYQIKFAKIRSISWRISNLQIWQFCK